MALRNGPKVKFLFVAPEALFIFPSVILVYHYWNYLFKECNTLMSQQQHFQTNYFPS